MHRLIEMTVRGELLCPAIEVGDRVTESEFDNVCGRRHFIPDGITRAADVWALSETRCS